MTERGLAAVVEEELRLVEILALTRSEVQSAQGHLGNLMSRHHARLSGFVAHLADDAVGIAHSDVKEGTLARSLIMCHGTLGHMS